MDKKRLIYAVIFFIFCILIGYGIYYVFFKKRITLNQTPEKTGTASQFPNSGTGRNAGQLASPTSSLPTIGTRTIPSASTTISRTTQQTTQRPSASEKTLITQATTAEAANVSVGKDGGARFYNRADGKFYQVNADGTTRALSDTVFYNVQSASWSPTKNETIIEYPDGSNIYYNFDSKEQVTLPKHWENFSFSPIGDKIEAKSIGIAPENRWLITSDPRGSNIKLVEPLGENGDKVIVDWSPNQQVIALSRTGEALGDDRQEVLMVGLNKENFKSVIVEGRGLETQWSPKGSKLLHSVYSGRNDYKPELWIVSATPDTAGGDRRLLNVNTWAEKCTMADERFVYCGVPQTLERGSGFAPTLADATPDNIYKIDTTTGIKTQIPLDRQYTVDRMYVSADGRTVYFTDKHASGIFQFPIK